MSVQTDTKELTDREVGRRLRRAIRSADTARDDDEYPDDLYEWELVSFVIPALDARGLGEKYAMELTGRVRELHMDDDVELRDALALWSELWRIVSAPLSLRARAALSVLEGNNA